MTKKLKGYGTFDVVLIVILVIVSFAWRLSVLVCVCKLFRIL